MSAIPAALLANTFDPGDLIAFISDAAVFITAVGGLLWIFYKAIRRQFESLHEEVRAARADAANNYQTNRQDINILKGQMDVVKTVLGVTPPHSEESA